MRYKNLNKISEMILNHREYRKGRKMFRMMAKHRVNMLKKPDKKDFECFPCRDGLDAEIMSYLNPGAYCYVKIE